MINSLPCLKRLRAFQKVLIFCADVDSPTKISARTSLKKYSFSTAFPLFRDGAARRRAFEKLSEPAESACPETSRIASQCSDKNPRYLSKRNVLLLISVFQKSFIKISNELSRNFQDFHHESFLSSFTDEGDDNNLRFEKLGDNNSNNGTLVFLIQNI
jgi:hypothetical protein